MYEGDIANEAWLDDLFAAHRVDAVCHLAARAGVRPSLEDPHIYVHSNIHGTVAVLECAHRHGVRHLALASSSSVYGANAKVPFSEDDAVAGPCSPYAATKRSLELLAYTYHHLYDLSVSCLRFFTVYGPSGRPDMAPFKFIDRVARGEPIDQYGDGSSSRDYTYIDDIVDGVVRATDTPLGYQIFNLGNGNPVLLTEFIRTIEKHVGRRAVIRYLPNQPGDVPHTFADVQRARDLLGYQPSVPLDEGIRRTAAWYKEYRSQQQQAQQEEGEEEQEKEVRFSQPEGEEAAKPAGGSGLNLRVGTVSEPGTPVGPYPASASSSASRASSPASAASPSSTSSTPQPLLLSSSASARGQSMRRGGSEDSEEEVEEEEEQEEDGAGDGPVAVDGAPPTSSSAALRVSTDSSGSSARSTGTAWQRTGSSVSHARARPASHHTRSTRGIPEVSSVASISSEPSSTASYADLDPSSAVTVSPETVCARIGSPSSGPAAALGMGDVATCTRLHSMARLPSDLRGRLRAFLVSAARYSGHVVIGVEGGEERKDLIKDVEDVVEAARASTAAFFDAPPTTFHVLPITPWVGFSGPLNALLRFSASLGCAYVCLQSVEVVAEPRAVQLLAEHLAEDSVLVAGAALPGHTFRAGRHPATGVTVPWNTLAMWKVSTLLITGFLSVSDGLCGGKGSKGVEEVAVLAALQRLLGEQRTRALLVCLPPAAVAWMTDWSDSHRVAMHRRKVESKLERAASQLEFFRDAKGHSALDGTVVDHVDASAAEL